MPKFVCYEQPLNERIRLLMRLESLFQQVIQSASGKYESNARTALQGLFEILNLASRTELKSELLKELERHSVTLNRLRQTEGVDLDTLDAILAELDRSSNQLRNPNGPSLEAIRQNGFLSPIRRRCALPGGACTFDLPALHLWLQQDSTARTQDIENWLQPFEPLQSAIDLILRLIRDSALPRNEVAVQGFFQKTLNSTAPNQMVRVFLPAGLCLFPEISGGRHRFSIRFMEQSDFTRRAQQINEDVPFQLVCCII